MQKVNYKNLNLEYCDKKSLQSRKIKIVDSIIPSSEKLLDTGVGMGELISTQIYKFKQIHGIDVEPSSIIQAKNGFPDYENIIIESCSSIEMIGHFYNQKFDVIICLDVVEHLTTDDANETICQASELLNSGGMFIFSGPSFFEKIWIFLDLSPTHCHSHPPYGWKKILKNSGLKILKAQTVAYPLVDSVFYEIDARIWLLSNYCWN